MQALKLKEGLYWNGILDSELKVFDIVMETEFGTTYNSYTVVSDKIAVIETAKEKYFDEYIKELSALIPPERIDYLIMNHTEPDHAGSVAGLLQINPEMVIVGTTSAINFLKQIVNSDFKSIVVKEGDTLSLGGKTLRFIMAPNLHWPDTMFTYMEQDAVLITCDAFGAHYSHSGILRSAVTDEEGYLRAAKYYFDNILGPFKVPFVQNALKKVQQLKVDMICTGHGPVLDSGINEILELYNEWSASPKLAPHTVIMPYVSAYGYTLRLAQAIKEGMAESGDIEVKMYDMVTASSAEVLSEIAVAGGVLFGTPTILGEALKPIWDLTTSIYPAMSAGKYAGAFGAYGWSGEGVPHITERLKQLRFKVVEGITCRFNPNEAELSAAKEFGYVFGCLMQGLQPKKPEERKKNVMLKCLICGAEVPEGIEVCPVCGMDKSYFKAME